MITIASFNIRYPNPDDGENFFPHRLPHILEKIQKEQPDIIGFQELMPAPFEALQKGLPGYSFVGDCRDAERKDESNRIAFRSDRFEAEKWGQFWLSPTPDVPGSRYEQQSICPRICTWVFLKETVTGKELLAVNTHLDHEQEYARMKGLEQIFRTIPEIRGKKDVPVLITGDFNLTPAEAPYALIEKAGYQDLTAGMAPTYHGFEKDEPVKIDYILCDRPVSFTQDRWHQCINGVYLSDHDPVLAHIDSL